LGANSENNLTFGLETVNDLDISVDYSREDNLLSNTAWTKVVYLRAGDEIAVANFPDSESKNTNDLGSKLSFEKITSIEYVGKEQVYDIEVEGTHNFIANGILAHNTYISGNVGIGTTGPGYKLDVSGNGRFTGTVVGADATLSTEFVTLSQLTGGTGQYWSRTGTNLYPTTLTDYIGIGTTAPIGPLQVNNGATPAFVVTSAGNIGIGTINPVQKLHVEGQCVTGDSLLAIAKMQNSKCKAQNDSEKCKIEEIEYKQIKDIKGGEQVLSLDEKTGKIVPARIKGLLDMGVQPVYKLTTEDGKTIRTTGNHPYLAKKGRLSIKLLRAYAR